MEQLTLKERVKRLGLSQRYIANAISDERVKVAYTELCALLNGRADYTNRNGIIKKRFLNYLVARERERGFDCETSD